MSAPGAGKTSLLEAVLGDGREGVLDGVRVGVLEGDVQGSMDADRLAHLHVPVTQLNTDNGFGGECHLDANMVRSAMPALPLADIDLLIIENVGNLVCPAEFRVGEDARAMICSVTEGEDKPLKYPLMFRACEFVVINKIDLLPHLEFDVEKLVYNVGVVNPAAKHIQVSARTGEGVEEFPSGWWARRSGSLRPRERRRGHRAGRRRGADRRAAPAAHHGQSRLLRRRGRSACHAVPPDGRAVRGRRPAAGPGLLAAGALRRPARGRGVRAPGDRGQARAARAGAHRRGRAAGGAARAGRGTARTS